MTDKAWRSVSVTTISNCFKSCGFSMSQEEASEEPLEPDMSLEADWNKLQNTEVQFEDYVTCDEGLATTGTQTDAEIIDIVNQDINEDNVDENDVDHTDPADFEPLISKKKLEQQSTHYDISLKDVMISKIVYSVHYLNLKNN
ncbi:hypothetical protein HHI36_001977 [Cryptolaemus montrouzieri]|uniref:Uncharacterized protein n=1 Tax=Cryptolaemus montrouzieri TaxID=559131 RepID=A0ABD2P9T6_9CUCU